MKKQRRITVKPRVRSKTGLKGGRIDWDNYVNRSISVLADQGLHAKVVAQELSMSIGQVYNRAGRLGIRFRDFRNGNSLRAQNILFRYHPDNVTKKVKKEVRHAYTERANMTGLPIPVSD
jgi:hypothetical protein